MVKMAAAADHPEIVKNYPVIAQSLQQAASGQLRNMATLGGNVQAGERNGSVAGRPCEVHRRVKRNQTLGKVAWISRDAIGTGAEESMLPVEPIHCRAARAGVALVADGPGRIAKIRTPGPLKHAAVRPHAPALRWC
jgi:CO/xanthine dehydrogenase FAD-binding subunit